MIEEEAEAITDARNVTSDAFSLAFNPQREILVAICAGEKVENPNKLVNAVTDITINDVGCELNGATVSDAQVEFPSYPDRIAHTNNVIAHQDLLSTG